MSISKIILNALVVKRGRIIINFYFQISFKLFNLCILISVDDGLDDSTEEVTIVNGASSVNGDSLLHLNDGEQVPIKKNLRIESGNEIAIVENENEGDDDQKTFYDKSKSFFDSISCEAVERSKG